MDGLLTSTLSRASTMQISTSVNPCTESQGQGQARKPEGSPLRARARLQDERSTDECSRPHRHMVLPLGPYEKAVAGSASSSFESVREFRFMTSACEQSCATEAFAGGGAGGGIDCAASPGMGVGSLHHWAPGSRFKLWQRFPIHNTRVPLLLSTLPFRVDHDNRTKRNPCNDHDKTNDTTQRETNETKEND